MPKGKRLKFVYMGNFMTIHLHLIAEARDTYLMQNIVRDLKRHTSKQLLKAFKENAEESRREWMLAIFKNAGVYNSNNIEYQFWRQDNKPIER